VTVRFEHDSKPSSPIKDGEINGRLSYYELLKKNSAT
jgi:hypothetical protein